MKCLIGLGVLGLVATIAGADMTVVQKVETSQPPGQTMMMTLMIKGTKARIDFKPEPRSSLIDLQARKIYLIDHTTKQVMVMSLDQMKQAMELASQSMKAPDSKMTFQKTSNVKTINGFKCQEYKLTSPGALATPMTCWMAEEVDAKEMEPFRVFAMDIAKMIGQETMAQMKGMMIASEATLMLQDKETKTRSEVQSISREAIADSVFVIPPDYKSMEMPAIPPMSPPPSK